MRLTVLGGRGFIGRHIVAEARARGLEVVVPARDARPDPAEDLGHVIYAIGLTADFRTRPFDTVTAHVGVLADWLKTGRYDSFLYLSSTRIYGRLVGRGPATEEAALAVVPGLDGLYDLSKLTGEALCLADPRPTLRVARLSNIYGPGMSPSTFLGSILQELRRTGKVVIGEDPASCKDYMHVADAARLLLEIAIGGRARSYNVASGLSTRHDAIAQLLAAQHGWRVDFAPNAPRRLFPAINTERIAGEFAYAPRRLTDDLGALLAESAAPATPENIHV